MKICTKCKTEKSTSLFYVDKKSKDGFSYWCHHCVKSNVKKHREIPEYKIKQQAWNKKWSNNNIDLVRAIKRKSQNKIYAKLKIVGHVTADIRKAVYGKYNYKCARCSSIENKTVDHIIPISKGGTTMMSNLQLLCRSCNSRKSTS